MTSDDLALARLVIESGAIIWLVAEDQLIVDEPAARLFGVHRGAFGSHLTDLIRRVHDDHRDPVARALERAITDGGVIDIELVIDIPDGTLRHIQLRGTMLHDPDGSVQRVVFGARDVSALVALREEVAEAKRATSTRDQEHRHALSATEDVARTRATLLASLSHEIRSRLSAVLGMSRLLLDADLGVEQRERVSTIHNAGDELVAFAADIVDISTGDSPSEADLATVSVRQLLAEAVRAVASDATAKQLAIRADVDDNVPVAVRADGSRLARALHHLLHHAIEATTSGEVAISARVEPLLRTSADLRPLYDLSIEVRDTSAGVARESGFGGLGLQLGTRLVERLGGRVALDREPGRGSTVRIELCVDETVPEPATSIDIDPMLAAHHPLRILIAEDNPVNRKLLDAFLNKLGYRARHAVDGRRAIEAVDREPFDLIFMDIHMPEVDGIEATLAIRSRTLANPVRIVALTANALPQDRAACLKAGCDEYLTKPITVEKLARALLACPKPALVEIDPHAVDDRALSRLELAIGGPLLEDVLAAHASDAREVLSGLQTAIDRGDTPGLVRFAQMLGATSLMLRAAKLRTTSTALETQGRRGDLTSARSLAVRASTELAQVCAALSIRAGRTRSP